MLPLPVGKVAILLYGPGSYIDVQQADMWVLNAELTHQGPYPLLQSQREKMFFSKLDNPRAEGSNNFHFKSLEDLFFYVSPV